MNCPMFSGSFLVYHTAVGRRGSAVAEAESKPKKYGPKSPGAPEICSDSDFLSLNKTFE